MDPDLAMGVLIVYSNPFLSVLASKPSYQARAAQAQYLCAVNCMRSRNVLCSTLKDHQ